MCQNLTWQKWNPQRFLTSHRQPMKRQRGEISWWLDLTASVVSSFSFLCLVSSKVLIYYSILLSQNISLSPYLFTMLRFDFVAARLSNCCHTMEMEHFRKKKFSWVFCQQNYGDRRLRGKKMFNFVFKGYNVFTAVIYNICFFLSSIFGVLIHVKI